MEEAKHVETEARAALLRAAPLNRDDEVDDSAEFERRLAVADRALKAREIELKEQEARSKAQREAAEFQLAAELKRSGNV